MSAHTKEPWKVYERKLPYTIGGVEKMHTERSIGTEHDHPQLKAPYPICCISTGLGVNKGELHYFVSLKEADARRIVGCVNACESIPTELLESKTQTPRDAFKRIAEQRDELLAALKVLRERHQIEDPHHADICEYCKQADSIINKVEAGK